MAALPAYSFVLGLIALLGLMAIAAKIKPVGATATSPGDRNTVVPLLFDWAFPDWFAGVAHAAVGIGALVPAAVMSIAAANLFTRNIWTEYVHRDASPAEEARVSKIASLAVKFAAVLLVLGLDTQYSIDLQLIGGVIILQTLPAVAIGVFTRWFHKWALVAGWVAGMAFGFWMLWTIPNPATKHEHFGGSAFKLSELGFDTKWTIYAGFLAVALNLIVAALGTVLLRAVHVADGEDATADNDYTAEAGDPKVRDIPELVS
jgi:SSS family solute:Na+ symporter